MKKILAISLLFVMLILLTGCIYRYRGEHNDLYSVAINNIFGANGYRTNGEAVYDPYIEILETDDYGRILFLYDEGYRNQFGTALLIMQKRENDCVYYYQDICYIPLIFPDDAYKEDKFSYQNYYSEKQITALKDLNDWNKPLNFDKCTSSVMAERKSKEGKLDLQEKDFEKAISTYAKKNGYKGDDNLYRYSIYCNTDKYGREIYYVYGIGRDVKGEGVSPNSVQKYYDFALIFNPDKSCPIDNICEITDLNEYYKEVTALKENCGWNTPY